MTLLSPPHQFHHSPFFSKSDADRFRFGFDLLRYVCQPYYANIPSSFSESGKQPSQSDMSDKESEICTICSDNACRRRMPFVLIERSARLVMALTHCRLCVCVCVRACVRACVLFLNSDTDAQHCMMTAMERLIDQLTDLLTD